MSVEVLYLLRKDEPDVSLRDLDDVRLLADVVTDDGETILAGSEGTIVAVLREGEAFIVEFAEPAGAFADVGGAHLERVGRRAP